MAETAAQLKVSSTPRDTVATPTGEASTFHLGKGVDITFNYAAATPPSGTQLVTPMVGSGADPWPYITLDSAEQSAVATGAGATIVALICAAVVVETAGTGCIVAGGIGAVIIGVAYAHGICSNGKNERIYVLALSASCVN